MTNSYKFIEKQIKMLFDFFPKANIRYEFRESRNIHLVEITPLHYYNSDKYKYKETEIEDEFESLFPSENIIFISEDSLNKIVEPNIEHLGEIRGKVCVISNSITSHYNFINIPTQYAGENNYALAA